MLIPIHATHDTKKNTTEEEEREKEEKTMLRSPIADRAVSLARYAPLSQLPLFISIMTCIVARTVPSSGHTNDSNNIIYRQTIACALVATTMIASTAPATATRRAAASSAEARRTDAPMTSRGLVATLACAPA